MNAILFLVIWARFAWAFPQILWKVLHASSSHLPTFLGVPTAVAIVVGGTIGYGTLATIFSMTWWTLGQGKPSARAWAIASSVAVLPFFLFGNLAMVSSGLGVLGLVVFRRRQTVAEISRRTSTQRLAGDGTNGVLDWLATALMYGGVLLGGSVWSHWAEKHGLPADKNFVVSALMVEAAALLATALHELGHALTALTLKMKVRQFLCGPLEWRRRASKWDFRFHPAGLLSFPGAVGVAPVNLKDLKLRRIAVCAAGPLVSLVLAVVTAGATFAAKGHQWEPYWHFLAYLSTFSLLGFIVNLIPIQPDGQYSDGARIYQMMAGTPGAKLELAYAMISSTMVSSIRPKDLDVQTIENIAALRKSGKDALVLEITACTHYFDSGQIQEALKTLDRAEAIYRDSESVLPADFRIMAQEAFTFKNAYIRRDAHAARGWWDRSEKKSGARSSADHWKAYCSLLWIEKRFEEAGAAWKCGNALAEKAPSAGAFDYSRDCFTQLRTELDAVAA
jgi:Zn-dependent protease